MQTLDAIDDSQKRLCEDWMRLCENCKYGKKSCVVLIKCFFVDSCFSKIRAHLKDHNWVNRLSFKRTYRATRARVVAQLFSNITNLSIVCLFVSVLFP